MNELEPTVALVFSPEAWVEELHRHLADHGGARVRQIVVEPSVALEEEYDALIVSDRWPALTRSFVEAVHGRDRRVLGVFDPDEPAGKDHLVAIGADATIESDAPVAEFVTALEHLQPHIPRAVTRSPGSAPAGGTPGPDTELGRVVAVAGPRGSGCTEVALALATVSAARSRSVVLVDAHELAPSVAGRLGLSLEPNLRSAVEAQAYGLGQLDDSLVRVGGRSGFHVVAGFPSANAATQVSTRDVLDVITTLRRSFRYVFVDLDAGPHAPVGHAVLGESHTVVGVGLGTPVGVTRLLEWIADSRGTAPEASVHAVVNRAPRDRFRRSEITAEICRATTPSTLVFAPTDRHVEDAAWDGRAVARGPFVEALLPLAGMVAPVAGVSGQSRRRRNRSRR